MQQYRNYGNRNGNNGNIYDLRKETSNEIP